MTLDYGEAYAVNNAGQVVGFCEPTPGARPFVFRAVRWDSQPIATRQTCQGRRLLRMPQGSGWSPHRHGPRVVADGVNNPLLLRPRQ